MSDSLGMSDINLSLGVSSFSSETSTQIDLLLRHKYMF